MKVVMTGTMVTKSYVKTVAKNGRTSATPKAKIVTKDYGDAGRKQMTNVIKGVPKRKKK
jgi:hypothetical protein